ncbi:unnamed protein product [Moneuplotes crassus]|uniref:FCP1 homology domain-containing protein n=1 Tax=Euplotes crassus TaxID=5936 RepID=A0AAD2DCC0_EUPCR|nr:unnamed protein product [Moneuplotes crassus]
MGVLTGIAIISDVIMGQIPPLLYLNANNKEGSRVKGDTYSRPYRYRDYSQKSNSIKGVSANSRISYTPQDLKRKAENLNHPRSSYDKGNIDYYIKKELKSAHEKRDIYKETFKGTSYDDYKKYYLERESVKRKPVESRLDFSTKSARVSKSPLKESRDKLRYDFIPARSGKKRRNDGNKSLIADKDQMKLDKKENKTVSVTPVKTTYPKYSAPQKNGISDSKTQVYKRYDNISHKSEQSEVTFEDVASQVPNPSCPPNPSKNFKNDSTPPDFNLPSPVLDKTTGGYLAPKTMENVGKKTLVLDLDETLIHSWFRPIKSPDLCLDVKIKNKFSKIYILTRPWVYDFLDEVQKIYEVVIFTASVSTYAIPIITKLDRTNYQFQMLFRQHCDSKDGSFVKDLSKLGRELKDCIIIDNTPGCYRFQKANALPIPSWFEDPRDRELDKLLPILKKLAKVQDVRPYIKKLVKGTKVSFSKIHRVFRNTDGYDSVAQSYSFRVEKDQKTDTSRSQHRSKSTRRHHKSKHSKTREIDFSRDPWADTTKVTESEKIKSMKSLKKESNLKPKIKHSFVNINNVNKKIYPKKKKSVKYSSTKKLRKDKEKRMTKESSTSLLQKNSDRLRKEIKEYSQKLKKSIPNFDIEDNVATRKQEETSKLANYAHNLRRSYLRSGKSRKKS